MEQMLRIGSFEQLAVFRPDNSASDSARWLGVGDEGREDGSNPDSWIIGCEVCGVWLVDENDYAEEMQCNLCGCWQHIRCWSQYLRLNHRYVPKFSRGQEFCCWTCEPDAWENLPAPPHSTAKYQKSRLVVERKEAQAAEARDSQRRNDCRRESAHRDSPPRADSAPELREPDQDEGTKRLPSVEKAKRTVIKIRRRSSTVDRGIAPSAPSSEPGAMAGTRSAGPQASSPSEAAHVAPKDRALNAHSEEDELEEEGADSDSDDGWRDLCEICGCGPAEGLEAVKCGSCGTAQHAKCWRTFLWSSGDDSPRWQDTTFSCSFCKREQLDSFGEWPLFSARLIDARNWGPRTVTRPLPSVVYPSSAEDSSEALSRAEENRQSDRNGRDFRAVARQESRGQDSVTDIDGVPLPRAIDLTGATPNSDDYRTYFRASSAASDWSESADARTEGAAAREAEILDVRTPDAQSAAFSLNHHDHQTDGMDGIDDAADMRKFDRTSRPHRSRRSAEPHYDSDGTFVPSTSARSVTAGTITQEDNIATSSSEAVSSEETIVATRKRHHSKRRRLTRAEETEMRDELHDLDVEVGEAAWFAVGAPAPVKRSLPRAFSVLAGLKRAAAWTPAAETFYSDTLKKANRATWRHIRTLAKGRKHARRQVRERHAEGALRAMLPPA